jgi:hypothetical protein
VEELHDEANQQAATPTASLAMNIITSPNIQRFSHDALVIFSTSHTNFILVI